MTEPTAIRGVLSAAGAALLIGGLVGCGGPANKVPPSTSVSSGAATASTSPGGPAGLVVDVTIANGVVTPTNVTLQATIHEPITFHVTSDAADELHVHSVPGHKFKVAAAPSQAFEFRVEVPGDVEVELHHLARTIATIQVRP